MSRRRNDAYLIAASIAATAKEREMSTKYHHSTANSVATVTISAAVLASAAFALAGVANAAPAGPGPVDQTVTQLQSDGYQVIVNKVGTEALSTCTIGAVRPGQTYSRTDSGAPGAQDDLVTTVTEKTVYVDLAC
jgi:hypothetical protein